MKLRIFIQQPLYQIAADKTSCSCDQNGFSVQINIIFQHKYSIFQFSTLYEPCAIVGLYPIDLEGIGVFGVFLQILLGQCLFYLLLVGWIDKGNDSSFETGT